MAYLKTERQNVFQVNQKEGLGDCIILFCLMLQGVAGTGISKEASDVILLNDDFNSIVNAVKWGRHIYYTVLKFLQFQFTVSWVAITVIIIGVCITGVSFCFVFLCYFNFYFYQTLIHEMRLLDLYCLDSPWG